jgi:hypothetical protein
MKTETQNLQLKQIVPGRAPITLEAPRLRSGTGQVDNKFQPLLDYLDKTDSRYTFKRGKTVAKLVWPGVEISPGELALLLKKLPGGRRVDGATRVGQRVASYAFENKLKRSALEPLAENGLVLRWSEPDDSLNALGQQTSRPAFEPSGERLAKVILKKAGKLAKAYIYRCPELIDPGFVLIRNGRVQQQGTWFGLLGKDEEAARYCQIVVKGDVSWEDGIPTEFRGKFRKLAQIAVQKSTELMEEEQNSGSSSNEIVERLLESTRFLTAYQNHKENRPPTVTIGQIIKMVWDGGGQLPIRAVRDRIGLPEQRTSEILTQMDSILRNGEEVILSMSMDRKILLVDRDRLSRLFSLQVTAQGDERTIRTETVLGEPREVTLPMEVTLKERRVLEALLRYGRLSEGELSDIVGSRRVGGLLEQLLSRLEDNGFHKLTVAGEGDQGRIFEL